jgi:hypothetical protein
VNDLDELSMLESELGDSLRRCLDGVLGAEHVNVENVDLMGATADRAAVLVGVAAPSVARRLPLRWLLPAAAVLVVGVVGVVVWPGSRSPGVRPSESVGDEPRSASTVGTVSSEEPAVSQLPAPTTTLVPGDLEGFVWAPTVEPAFYRMTDVSVTTGGAVFDRPAGRYLRRGADGVTVDAWVEVSSRAEREGDAIDQSSDATVHDLPANLTEAQPGVWELSWLEGGLLARIRAAGVDQAAVLLIAESTIVNAAVPELRLEAAPVGFEDTPTVVDAPDDAPTTSYSWLPVDGRAGMFIDASARPNTGGHTLDTLQAISQQPAWENTRIELDRSVVGKVPAWVATSFENEFGRLISITWIEGAFVLSVSGRADVEQLQEVAEGFAPADLDVAREFRQRVDTAALELPLLDEATTPSGAKISIHTTGTGANVVCVQLPFRSCQYTTSESSLVGDEQAAVVEPFSIDGRTWMIGWAEGEHTPQLVRNDRLDPITDTARGTAGTFFLVADPDEAAQFVFDPGDQETGPMFGASITRFGAEPLQVLV